MDQPFVTLIEMAKNSTLPPAIIGTTTDEGFLFVELMNLELPLTGKEIYDAMLLMTFKFHVGSVVKTYNSLFGAPKDYIERLSMIVGDYLFICPARQLLATISEGQQNTWGYHWNRGIIYNDTSTFCYEKPCHGTELVYVFGTVTLWGQQFLPSDASLSRQIQTYWRNMANNSDPNIGPGGIEEYPVWTSYSTEVGAQMCFDIPIGDVSYNYRDNVCDFLDTISYDRSDALDSCGIVRSSLILILVGKLVYTCTVETVFPNQLFF